MGYVGTMEKKMATTVVDLRYIGLIWGTGWGFRVLEPRY